MNCTTDIILTELHEIKINTIGKME